MTSISEKEFFTIKNTLCLDDELNGIVIKQGDRFAVEASCECDEDLDGQLFPILTIPPRFERLVAAMATSGDIFKLYLDPEGDVYHVTDFDLVESPRGFNESFYDHIVAALDFTQELEEDYSYCSRYIFRNLAEADMYFNAVKRSFPDWVQKAYLRNRSIIVRPPNEGAKKHANSVNAYLVDVDWQPRKLIFSKNETFIKGIMDEQLYGLAELKAYLMELVAQRRASQTFPKKALLIESPYPGCGTSTFIQVASDVLSLALYNVDFADFPSSFLGSSSSMGDFANMYRKSHSATFMISLENLDMATASLEFLKPILSRTGFHEKYSNLILPTNDVFVVGTCRDHTKIDPALLPYFELIRINPYSTEEKRRILLDFVLPREIKKQKLPANIILLDDSAIELLLTSYATDAGVHGLEACVEKVVRKYIRALETGRKRNPRRPVFTAEDLYTLLGPPPESSP